MEKRKMIAWCYITSKIEIDTNENIIEKTYYLVDAISFRSDDEENPRLLNECTKVWEGEVRVKNSKKVVFYELDLKKKL